MHELAAEIMQQMMYFFFLNYEMNIEKSIMAILRTNSETRVCDNEGAYFACNFQRYLKHAVKHFVHHVTHAYRVCNARYLTGLLDIERVASSHISKL